MTIGIAGGGQLGRMLAEAARTLGLNIVVLDATPQSPAGQVADEHIVADYKDAEAMRALASRCDVLTYEVESVNAEALERIERAGIPVHPTARTLSLIKDKLRQKEHLAARGIPLPAFCDLPRGEEEAALSRFGFPAVLKARSGGFDGRGNAFVRDASSIPEALAKIGGVPLYAERVVSFSRELAVVAVRTTLGDIRTYPLVETVHRDHICHEVLCPAPVPLEIAAEAYSLVRRVLESFDGAGVFGIEMFQTSEGILVNEVAPRVHNSGHLTIEACETSQFENHMRVVAGLPPGETGMKVPAAVMVNILGERNGSAEPKGIAEAESCGASVHLYGKIETRVKRKMGHLTVVGESVAEAREKALRARACISI